MKVIIYVNPEKDQNGIGLKTLTNRLEMHKIEYVITKFGDKMVDDGYSALFVIGGDGTILRRTDFANKSRTPIIGINGGKLGYLSEFERSEINDAVDLFASGKLIKDCRATMLVNFKGKEYLALNDVIIQRTYCEENRGMIINLSFYIDGTKIDTVVGDGMIACTPTGSTAYSLSAGGPILTPGINAFSATPISAHSLSQRPVIFSSDSKCEFELEKGYKAGLYVDGKLIDEMIGGDRVLIVKAERDTIFLRRTNSNFYKKLTEKLHSRNV